MIKLGLSKAVLGRMDAGFMFTYAFGAPLAGQLGDMYDPSRVLGIGLYGSALCIFLLIFGMWNDLGKAGPFVANGYFLGVYLVFGFFQAIGGPVRRGVEIVSSRQLLTALPRQASRDGLQLSSHPTLSKIGGDTATT